MIASFNEFIQKYLSNVGMYKKDGPFKTDIEIVNLHPSIGTHWVAYVGRNFFDSYTKNTVLNFSKR